MLPDKRDRGSRARRGRAAGSGTEPSLFDASPALLAGLRYRGDLLSPEEERQILQEMEHLPFKAFEFHGYVGKRRVVSYGWHYDFGSERLREADDMPSFLLPARDKAAVFAGLRPADLVHVLITEYAPGAGIGWHKDKAVFGEVVGISLLSACVFRLRRRIGPKWERVSFVAEPRSAYLLDGPARTEWEHSIASVDTLRYSLTFRSLRPA